MDRDRITPLAIERYGERDIRIRWKDEHESLYTARALRLACPCANCVDELTGAPLLEPASVAADIHPKGVGLVGHYAISILWSDNHSSGIYSYSMLRDRCPCNICRPL